MPVYKCCTKATQKVMHMLNYKMYLCIYISLNKKNPKNKKQKQNLPKNKCSRKKSLEL